MKRSLKKMLLKQKFLKKRRSLEITKFNLSKIVYLLCDLDKFAPLKFSGAGGGVIN